MSSRGVLPLFLGLLVQIRPLIAPKKGDKRTKPLRPPMRALRRLKTRTPHTIRHLDSCPIMVVIDGPVRKAGRAGATAIGLGHIVRAGMAKRGAPAFDDGRRRVKGGRSP
jgi:hypothetical protein